MSAIGQHAFVSHGHQAGGSVSPATTNAVTTQVSGSTFLVSAGSYPTGTINALTDSKGNTYTLVDTQTYWGGLAEAKLWKCEGGTGGANHSWSVTKTAGAEGNEISVFVVEITTAGAVRAYSLKNTAFGLDNTPIAGVLAGDALVAFLYGDSNEGNETFAPGAGYTKQDEEPALDGNHIQGASAAMAIGTGGTYDCTWTTTGASGASGNNPIRWLVDVANTSSTPAITVQPTQQTGAVGGSATFGASANGATSFQWQSAPADTLLGNVPGTWSDVAGETAASYTHSALVAGDNGSWYRLKASNAAGDTYSTPARLFLSGIGVTGMASAGWPNGMGGWLYQHNMDRSYRNVLLRNRLWPGDLDGAEAAIWGDWFWPATTGGTLNASASGSDTAAGQATAAVGAAGAATGGDVAGGSATAAVQIAVSAVGVAVAGGSAQRTVAVSAGAVGLDVAAGGAVPSATVAISALGLAQAAGQAGVSATILAAGAGAAQAAGNAVLAAQIAAIANGAAQAGGSASGTASAPGSASASGGAVAGGSAVLAVNVQIQASGGAVAGGSATAARTALAAASGSDTAAGTATASVAVQVTAAGFAQAMGAGYLAVSIPLAAFGAAQAGGHASASLVNANVDGPVWMTATVRHLSRFVAGQRRLATFSSRVQRVY